MWLHLARVCEPGSRAGYGDIPVSAKIYQLRFEAAQLYQRQRSFGIRLLVYFICSACYVVSTDAKTDLFYIAAEPHTEGALQTPLLKVFSFPKEKHGPYSVCHVSNFIGEHVFTLYMCVCVCVCIISIFTMHTYNSSCLGKKNNVLLNVIIFTFQ